MMIKLLNKIGLYTSKQMRVEKLYVKAIDARLRVYMHKCRSLEEENEKLKLKIARNKQNRRKGRR